MKKSRPTTSTRVARLTVTSYQLWPLLLNSKIG